MRRNSFKKYGHISVLKEEIVSLFDKKSIQVFVDGTLGVGGHSKMILESHPEIKVHVGIDKDEQAIEQAKQTLWDFRFKLKVVHGDFREIKRHLADLGIRQVQGVILDLGVSSIQLDIAERGFSFSKEGPLDMRMNPRAPLSAKTIVNTYSQEKLADIFFQYGEERKSRMIARAITEQRNHTPFETTKQLADLIERKLGRSSKTHPATRVFQALRIEVNGELEALKQMLEDVLEVLEVGGVCGIISFHSLEDRIVKQFMQQHLGKVSYGVKGEKRIEPFTKKPITPTKKEMEENPRSRSAKLRAFSKL